ncbi:MAG: hypothetical protein EOS40_00560 [Mesorhizobium sp.]|nr:hypothetical protein EJ071_31280 [Mesorhizobium sp. M1B.F.Ca.ET.045.04.1.1]RWB22815.1 MAG: hypothetical protein EOQ40_03690 [Mesorhizobium sp.]RWE04267.1 MAG: hypothetical protein EOS40_00560 [Mesorhizobium sp.]TIS50521.1 MAG: hypothetical protein E5W96_09575 [Mesorhizobium sp.]
MAETPIAIVILGRSKERSSVAKTLESMPLPSPRSATEQNSAPWRRFQVTAWILWSAPRRFAPCSAIE